MATLPFVAGAVLVVAGLGAFAGSLGAFDPMFGDEKPCRWHIGPPLVSGDARTLRMLFNNSVGVTDVRICTFDAEGLERTDDSFQAPVSENHVVEIAVPRGPFLLVIEAGVPEGYKDPNGSRLGGLHQEFVIDPSACVGPISKGLPIGSNSHGYMWYGLPIARCDATGEPVEAEYQPPGYGPSSNGTALALGSAPFNGPPGVGLGSVLTAMGLFLVLAANWNAFGVGAIASFSRLTRPKVLDQPTRSRIVDLVTVRPGVRFQDIATALDLATGTTMHHLRVLVREKVLCRVRNSYFVRGAQDHRTMVAEAALTQPRARDVYEAISRGPHQTLPQVARSLGMSRSWVGKVAKDLERAGLLRRQRVGRSFSLEAPPRSAAVRVAPVSGPTSSLGK